jgi:hypothetical protein
MKQKTANHKLEIKMNKHIKPLEKELMEKQDQKNLARLVGVIDTIRENYDNEIDMMVELLQDAGFNHTDAWLIVENKFGKSKCMKRLTFWEAKALLDIEGRKVRCLEWHKSLKDCYLEILIIRDSNYSYCETNNLMLFYWDNGLLKMKPHVLSWEEINSSQWIEVKS